MKLSIITINLNNLPGLQKTVESVLSQTWREFEYIIIDGGSTDGSADYISGISNDLTYWISEKDTGVYHAMNKGIEKSTGEYLLFLNSGDYLVDSNILKKVQPELTGEGIIFGDLVSYDPENKSVFEKFPDHLDPVYVYEHSLPHPASFIKKELFGAIGKYNEQDKITSDWQFFMRALFELKADYKHIPLGITVYDRNGLSNLAANANLIIREKEQFIYQNPQVLLPDLFHSINETRDVLRSLGNSRIIKFVLSLGFLGYFKKYLERHA